MNKKVLEILEYNKIIDMLKEEAGCAMSAEMISALTPYDGKRCIEEEMKSTTEAADLIAFRGPLPTAGIYDTAPACGFARKGGTLSPRQLLSIECNLRIASDTAKYMERDMRERFPEIASLTELLMPCRSLAEEIGRCILSEEEISDNASVKLSAIRRGIGRQNEAIRSRITRIMNSPDNRPYLRDAIATVRDGRYVIPVKQEYRSRFPGVIHDQSKAGTTLFIEPQVIVDMNNELRALETAEKGEIERILGELSEKVAEHYLDLRNNQKLLTRLDFIMAKGKLSRRMRGEEPGINEEGILELKNARHPLIDPEKVVPISISVGRDYRTLVVTGPNTGGKTVTLKTTGLLALMAQSGLHIPADGTSRIPVYSQVFADIGDEQSIEQSLSTFSSHMKNIVAIVEQAGEGSLVLLDELGAGTDPTEGAALGISILEKLYSLGVSTVATTHYNELKKYALSSEGVENASMEFDVDTLSPTFKLITGIPGKSNAFEISKKLGLPGDVIERAGQLIEGRDMEFEDVISAIEEDRKRAEAERGEAIMLNIQAGKKQAEMEKKLADLEGKRAKILENAREEARQMLLEARETAGQVQKELKGLLKLESGKERIKRFEDSSRKLKREEEKYAARRLPRAAGEPLKASEIKTGARVRVLSLGRDGEVLSLPDKRGNVDVRVGTIKATVSLRDLARAEGRAEKEEQKRSPGYVGLAKQKARNISVCVNVLGERLDEAKADVDKYLDDAFVAGLREVTVIHGRGEGVLKNGLRNAMKNHRHVASFRKGGYDEGGDGVTVVTIKTE